jgi:hypothetical protein
VRTLTFVVLAAAIAGCGSSSSGGETSTGAPVASAPAITTTPASAELPSPCDRRARAVIPGGATAARPFTARNGSAGCRLRGRQLEAVVYLDSAPQAYTRMEREQVEFWQNVEWSHKTARAAPRPITTLGLGGYWFPVQSRLLTTDGVRLITIKVRAPSIGPAERRAKAVELAQVYLGPLQKPPGY